MKYCKAEKHILSQSIIFILGTMYIKFEACVPVNLKNASKSDQHFFMKNHNRICSWFAAMPRDLRDAQTTIVKAEARD